MQTLEVKQGSLEWLQARAGIVTASELDNLITPEGAIRSGQTPLTYFYRKLAERWTGLPADTGSSYAMEQGSILEDEARPWLALHLETDIDPVGFVLTDDRTFGASPDGLILGGVRGVEIKCPQPPAQVRYLIENRVPPQYLMQIHGGMLATGAGEWVFASYSRALPKLVLAVKRDEAMIDLIRGVVAEFTAKLQTGWDRMVEANGGEPVRALGGTDSTIF